MRRHGSASRHRAGGHECHPGGPPNRVLAGADGRLHRGDMETVEDCVTETLTGFQRRRPEHRTDQAELRDRLARVHAVGERERAVLAVRTGDIALDRGEASLWAHALSRGDDWVLCGPDKASLQRPSLLDQAIDLAGMNGD